MNQARHAPSVPYLTLEDVAADRGRDAHLDLAHYCIDAPPFETALALLLTAVVAHVEGEGARQPAPRLSV